MDIVRPKYEKSEKHRLASLDPKEKLKEEGDNAFKNSQFEVAIKAYTKCLDTISDKVFPYKLKLVCNNCSNNYAYTLIV